MDYVSILESAYKFHGIASILNLIDSNRGLPVKYKKKEK